VSDREQAIVALCAIWEDEGEDFLWRAGLGPTWADVLAPLPDVLFDVSDSPFPVDDTLLGRLRELFVQAELGDAAVALAEAAYELRSQRLGPRNADTLVAQNRLGVVLDRFGDPVLAGVQLEAAARGLREALPKPDVRQALAYADLARHLHTQGDLERAQFFMEQAYRVRRIVTPDRSGLIAAQLAELRLEAGQESEGAELLQDAWNQLRRERGDAHNDTLDRARTLGPLWLRLEQPARAVPPLRSLWAAVEHADDEDEAMRVAFDLGRALTATGHDEEGFRLIDRAVAWCRDVEDEDGLPHPDLPQRLVVWSRLLEERGNADEAEGYLLEAVEAEKLLHGDESAEVGLRQAAVGDFLHRRGRYEEALGWMDAGLSLVRSSVGDEHDLSRVVGERLVEYLVQRADAAFDELRDPGLAREYIDRARFLTLDVLGSDHPLHRTVKYYRNLR
jgi:tetratricopeptide (TPR) repeat protein